MFEKISKVLVAEDNKVVRKGLTSFLTKWGFSPIEASNGDDAIKILETDQSVRLAIIDWNLPGLSGLQICQRLRIQPQIPYIYIIMFSARKSNEEKVLALEGGADDYLIKPCKPSELRARLTVGRRIIETALSLSPSAPPEHKEEPPDESTQQAATSPTEQSANKPEKTIKQNDN